MSIDALKVEKLLVFCRLLQNLGHPNIVLNINFPEIDLKPVMDKCGRSFMV